MGILLFGFIRDLTSAGTLGAILLISLLILVFVIIREITLWYFRIDKNTETLESISASLEKIAIAADYLATDIDYKNHYKEKKEELVIKNITNKEVDVDVKKNISKNAV